MHSEKPKFINIDRYSITKYFTSKHDIYLPLDKISSDIFNPGKNIVEFIEARKK